jgi:butyryl-CoA dehydrogenase
MVGWSDIPMRQANHEDLGEAGLDPLVENLAKLDGAADEAGGWPTELWATLEASGVTRWALPREFGGEECDRLTLLRRYARVAEGSMTAAFILSQHDAGVRRLLAASDRPIALAWLQKVDAGLAFPTVGISQLTTSRRHGDQAVRAVETGPNRFRVDGLIPWVTAASRADMLVAGASTSDGRQILFALPTDQPGVVVKPPFALAALQASCTAEIACEGVEIEADHILAGPSPDVMASPAASGTGGLETSALALGQSLAALKALEISGRDDLLESVEALRYAWNRLRDDLMACAEGAPGSPTSATVRGQANALVLRLTQAYLTARKGSGFLREDPAQRWARQALFFLVWSCPSPVAQAAIRDLAGLCST